MSAVTWARLERDINRLKGCVVPRQRGRRIQYTFFNPGHPAMNPRGFIEVYIGRPESRNVLSLSQGAALEFIAQVERHRRGRGPGTGRLGAMPRVLESTAPGTAPRKLIENK